MRRKKNAHILNAPIGITIIKLTIPSIFGMLGLMIFNIVDTYFVGQLGILELAAISFTFPVVMTIGSFTLGIGIGVMALFSKAVGSHNVKEEQNLATSSLILGVVISIVIAAVGILTIKPLFRLLGAGDDLLGYIAQYMRIWYIGSVFVVIPMIGDHVLRGLGDTKTPSFVMLTCAVTNAILDPLLIFGYGPFPRLGISGAAIATVFARMITMVVSLYVQIHREKLINLKNINLRTILGEWKNILFIGIPNSLVKMIAPIAVAVFTALLAFFGNEAVAGYGVAAKVEGFCLAIVHALSITAAVFVGQNLGSSDLERVKKGVDYLNAYSIIIGVSLFLFILPLRGYIGGLFNEDTTVQSVVALYLLIVPMGFGLFAITQISVSILNVLKKPLYTAMISILQMFVINIPLAFLLSKIFNVGGIFISILIAYSVAGILSYFFVKRELNKILCNASVISGK